MDVSNDRIVRRSEDIVCRANTQLLLQCVVFVLAFQFSFFDCNLYWRRLGQKQMQTQIIESLLVVGKRNRLVPAAAAAAVNQTQRRD